MEFLYRLYSNNYFGIGLFIVITILAFSFLVILFFGKKDEKEQIAKANKKNIEQENTKEKIETSQTENILPTEGLESVSLTMNEPAQTEPIEENISAEEAPILNPFINNEEILPIENEREEEIPSIIEEPVISETTEIPNIFTMGPILEDTMNTAISEVEEPKEEFAPILEEIPEKIIPVIEEETPADIFTMKPELQEEIPVKKPVMPASTQFSSVYVTKEKPVEEPNVVVEKPIEPLPKKPEFDLPKLNKEVKVTSNDNIIKPIMNEVNNGNHQEGNLNDLLANFEDDSYTINK